MRNRFQILLLFLMLFSFSCQRQYIPKPNSYYRIDFPEREYRLFDSIYPFTFEYPVYGVVEPDTLPSKSLGLNINFPKYSGTIFLTYLDIANIEDLDRFIEDDWRMIYSITALKADGVDEYLIFDDESNVYGMLYDISGNAASSVQFFMTDSVRNIIRGSLYFNSRPNYDSLAPVIRFFREDIIHLTKSFRWKNTKKNQTKK